MLYDQLKFGDYIFDPFMDSYGKVISIDDIHNVFVEYDGGGGGLYCLDPECEDYDGDNLKIIKTKE